MGLRDRIKETAKSLLGRAPAASEPTRATGAPAPKPASPAPAPAAPAKPAAPVAAEPSAAQAAPVAKAAAGKPAAAKAPARPARSAAGKPALPADVTEDGYRAVALATQVTVEKAGTFPLEGATIVAVFRHGGALYAIDNACAHEDGPVGEGEVTGKCVRCPYHDWEYDFTTGACRTDPERALATYAVRERDGYIWVGPRLTEGTKARGGDHNDGLETITR